MPPSTKTSSRLAAKKKEEEDAENQPLNGKAETTTTAKKGGSKVKGKTKAKQESAKKKTTEEKDTKASAKKKSSPKTKAKKAAKPKEGSEEELVTKKAAKKTTKKRKAAAAEDPGSATDEDDEKASNTSSPKKKKTKKAVQSITERDALPKLWSDEKAKANGSYTLKIASWNVAGLRAILRKEPEALAKLVTTHDIDVLCLQETKLQEIHLDDPKLKIRGHLLEEEGYDAYYSCSTAKKGYAGTAVFVRRRGAAAAAKAKQQKTLDSFFAAAKSDKVKEATVHAKEAVDPFDPKLLVPQQVSYGLGKEKHDQEGRVITLEFPQFTMANLYVPNSGQKLERLTYRTEEWDKDLVDFAKAKQGDRGLPFMWLGDLNVAHKNLEAYNFGAKHLDKQAGLTPQERASFTEQLEAGFVDAFRHLHPTAKGHYSYWSQRAGNREPNRGLRLDYFVCDPSFFREDSKVIARDSYMISDQLGSDHAPVVLELEIKP